MENSMLTGMRAIELGRPHHLRQRRRFCQMTGWTESDLVGRTPPFPYWPERPPSRQPARPLQEELARQSPWAAFEVRVDAARTAASSTPGCTSPADRRPRATQTGWMTSHDRHHRGPTAIRDQLSACARALHHRAGRRWTPCDVRGCRCGGGELLFANTACTGCGSAQRRRPLTAGGLAAVAAQRPYRDGDRDDVRCLRRPAHQPS